MPADLPAPHSLGPDAVHVWRASLDRDDACLARLGRLLSEDERARAGRFHFQKDRRHFIVGRGLLRVLLGRYLSREPAALSFVYGPHGKPGLADPPGAEGLCFNLSHSQGLALYAVARGRRLGVDVEGVGRPLAHEEIAERFFSAREREALRALPPGERAGAFFRCWTRKEAYLKAHGGGLSVPLDSFDVTLAPAEPARLLATRDGPDEAGRWCLRHLDVGPGYVGALAVEGDGWRLWCGPVPEEW